MTARFLLLLMLLLPARAQDDLGMVRLPGGPVERIQVPGGPTVLLQPIPDLPCASVCLLIPAGSRSDPAGKAGLAHLAEHLLYRATPTYPGGLLPALYEEIGATRGASTSEDSLLFWCTVPSRQLDLAMKVEADRLTALEFSQSDFARETELVAAELAHPSLAQRQAQELRRALFPLDPARQQPVAGEKLTVDALQPADARRFFSEHVRRDQAVLVIVGGFNRPKVRQELWRLFPRAGGGAPPVPPAAPIAPQPGLRDRVTETTPAASALVATYSLEGARAGDLAALEVACEGLGLPYLLDPTNATLQIWMPAEGGAAPAFEQFKTRLAHVREVALEPGPLETARARARSAMLTSWEDLAARARALAVSEAWGRLDWWVDLPARISALRADQVREVAAQRLAPEKAAVVYLQGTSGGPSPDPELAEAHAEGEDLSSPGLPGFTRIQLDNQLVLLIQRVHDLPTVTIRGYVLGGEQLDPPGQPGLTALAARALSAGPPMAGMELRFVPQLQTIQVEGWCPADQLGRWLERFAAAVQHPVVEPEALARELRRPEQSAYRAFLSQAFPAGHPYSRASAPQQASAAEAQAHLARSLRPDRIVLAISGDVDPAMVQRMATDQLAGWKVDPVPPPVPVPAAPVPQPVRIELAGGTGPYATVLVGQPGPGRNDSDYYAFNLLNQLLGGNPVTSRLAVRLRDLERLGPRVESRLLPASGSSPWAVVAQVDPDKVDRAVAVITDELRRATVYAPTEEELVRAQTALEGRLQVAQGGGAARADMLASVELYRLAESYPRNFGGIYGQIQAKDVLATAKARLHPDNLVVVILRPQ